MPANDRIAGADRPEQGPRFQVRNRVAAADIGLGPGISELPVDRQPFRPGSEAVRDLQDLLFLEFEGRIKGQGGDVAKAGKAIGLAAQLGAPAAGFGCRQILHGEIERIGAVEDRDLADQLARAGPGRLQRQLDVIAGQVARQQQIAFGPVAVEIFVLGELAEIGGQLGLGSAGLAACADGDDAGVERLHPDHAIFDPLGRHLDRGQIALVAKDGRGGVADFAQHRHRLLGPGERRPGGPHLVRRSALQIVELDVADRHLDVGVARIGQRTGRALDPADDVQRRPGRRLGRVDAGQLVAGRSDRLGKGGKWQRQ